MAKAQKTVNNTVELAVTRGSGNVFADLGFADAAELQVKAALTLQIANRIKSLKLTQAQASACLGLSQPDVSKLTRGRYTGFTADRLIAILSGLEVDVEIVLRPQSVTGSPRKGSVRILEKAS
jgi:predicted XRE-type DNA-binding protein